MSKAQKNIRTLSFEALENQILALDAPKYRSKQLYEWIWKHGATSFDAMNNLPSNIREALAQDYVFQQLTVNTVQKSTDGTIKVRFETYDHHFIEGVLIPTEERVTACISSQIGCSLSCKFCATGFMDRVRNLKAFEIFDQAFMLQEMALKEYDKPLSNIVYMGMGEPLLNYNEVVQSAKLISEGLTMSLKRITISTAGIAKMIKKLADDLPKVNFALSLHAAIDAKREHIMPINEQNSLSSLIDALQYFYKANKRKVTFEYIAFKNFNLTQEDAESLVKICSHFPSKVNIIQYNSVDGTGFKAADQKELDQFVQQLLRKRVYVTVRQSRGQDIDAACGQLANKNG